MDINKPKVTFFKTKQNVIQTGNRLLLTLTGSILFVSYRKAYRPRCKARSRRRRTTRPATKKVVLRTNVKVIAEKRGSGREAQKRLPSWAPETLSGRKLTFPNGSSVNDVTDLAMGGRGQKLFKFAWRYFWMPSIFLGLWDPNLVMYRVSVSQI